MESEIIALVRELSQYLSGGWIVGIIFLWVLRHDVLLPLGKFISVLQTEIQGLIENEKQKSASAKEIAEALKTIALK